ncbi:histidine phosphatase family protein [Herbaspirillum sp. RTI4]|uniref:histidine phosphatase family protein n=1 Tax=Herbaspirillum sp. RTI4 TaxID=3048640 RepID=UPI002AB35E65|nr:histidine phosphatase family protein [Herbaspirillum sp. RTI4]MDY7578969.1 histidine phosphatase family protein [Herbaspirillum sp. RTI4]MEA9980900.1 histidine phosphatase family protein [Herbaspirillum sp. RTI4]
MQTRLLLISHAATPAMRSGKFPANDRLDERGIEDAAAWSARMPVLGAPLMLSSPASCAQETARLLVLTARIEPQLADMDYGRWLGRRLADIAVDEPDALAEWSQNPHVAPHGGESFSAVVKRVGTWMDGLESGDEVVAVTHAAVIRAAIIHALQVPPAAFLKIEIAPLSLIELRRSARGWAWWPGRSE